MVIIVRIPPYCITNESSSKAKAASIPNKSIGDSRRDTALVLRAGFSIPLVTAAADSSSDVSVAETMRGITVHSSRANPRIFRSFMASRMYPNSSRIAGKYRSVTETATMSFWGICSCRRPTIRYRKGVQASSAILSSGRETSGGCRWQRW